MAVLDFQKIVFVKKNKKIQNFDLFFSVSKKNQKTRTRMNKPPGGAPACQFSSP